MLAIKSVAARSRNAKNSSASKSGVGFTPIMANAHQILTSLAGQSVSAEAFASAMQPLTSAGISNIAVAVSGGADSMALAILAADWAKSRGAIMTALTVDHRLRPESSSEAQTVAEWLAGRGVSHEVLSWYEGDVVRQLSRSAQDAARDARWVLLTQWCRANDCPTLLLAHHADDQIETFFMRLARGSGLTGLGGMDPATSVNTIDVLRPLLGFSKTDLVATCHVHGLDWIEDPSNHNTKYTRTRFRQTRAMMEAEGFTRERVLNTIAHLQRAKAALAASVRDLHIAACLWTPYGTASVSAPQLYAAPEDISLRLLSDLLRAVGGQSYGPRFEALQRLHNKLRDPYLKTITVHGCCVSRVGEVSAICREPSAVRECVDLVPMVPILWDGRFEITWNATEATASKFRIRPYQIADKALWKGYDLFALLAEMPARVRRTLPVIIDESGPVGMPDAGLWRQDQAAVSQDVTVRFVGRDRVASVFLTEFQGE